MERVRDLARDLRIASRSLRRSPLFVGVAALTLAFGIGVNATIFTFVNAIVLRPLPIDRPEEVLAVFSSWEGANWATSSYPDYLDMKEQEGVFSGLIGHSMAIANLQHAGRSETLVGEMVTGSYFQTLGVDAASGRALLPDDDVGRGSPRVVVLSHGLWQRRFGSDPSLVGRTVRFNGESYEVVGVAPESFPGLVPGIASSFWIAASHVDEIDAAGQIHAVHNDPGETSLESRGYRWMFLKGRLLPGVSPEQADARMAAAMTRLQQEHPITNEEVGLATMPVSDIRIHPDVDGVFGPVSVVLLGAVGLVLIIVCANLANMLLSRAQGRRREIAVRLALGAGRSRLVRQLLAESVLLAAIGGSLALVFAYWTGQLILAYQLPLPFQVSLDLGMDLRVVAFTGLVACLAAVIFGLVPALQASKPELVTALKQGSRSSGGAAGVFSTRNALVVVQVAVSVVLLIAGGLLVRGLSAARAIDVGFEPYRVADLPLPLSMHGYDHDRAEVFFNTLRERAAALPGVTSAAVAVRVPFDSNMHNTQIIPDATRPDAEHSMEVTWVDPEYHETVGVPIVRGRGFNSGDVEGTMPVAIVSEAMALRLWKTLDVVGKTFHRGGVDTEPFQIVGVSADHKVRTVGESPRPLVQFALAQRGYTYAHLLARSSAADATAVALAMRQTALELDPDLAFAEPNTLGDLMDLSLYPVKMGAFLLGTFGVLALLLASLGLYGVIAYSVSSREREFGIRVAIGARPIDIVSRVLSSGMTLVLVGLVVGLAVAAGTSRFLSGLLYGLDAIDPIAFGGAAVTLVTVALLANYLPAARAARRDPLTALRQG
ncbi:MAG: ABC transporter permease [Acidobacteriota bacterium]